MGYRGWTAFSENGWLITQHIAWLKNRDSSHTRVRAPTHKKRSKQTPVPEGSDYYQAFARLPLPYFRPGGLSIDLSSDPWWQVINEAGHLNNCKPGLRHQASTKSADRSQPTQRKWGMKKNSKDIKDKKSVAVLFDFIKHNLCLCLCVCVWPSVRACLVDFILSPNCEPLSYVLLQHAVLLLNVASGWTFCQGFSVSHLLTMSDNAYWSGTHGRRQPGKSSD